MYVMLQMGRKNVTRISLQQPPGDDTFNAPLVDYLRTPCKEETWAAL